MKAEPKAKTPDSPGKDVQGDFAQFTAFVRRLVAVPRSEIQQRLEAEKRAKVTASHVLASGTTTR